MNPIKKDKILSTNSIRLRSTAPVHKLNSLGLMRGAHRSRILLSSTMKIASAALVSVLLVLALANVGSTLSYFADAEASLNNILKADPLDFSVLLASTTIDMSSGSTILIPTTVLAEDSDPVQYMVEAHVQDGDEALCNALHVYTTMPSPYDGALATLHTGTSTELGPWTFNISIEADAIISPDTSCRIDLVYTGWNANAEWGKGYSDVEHVPLLFYINASSTPPAPAPAFVPSIFAGLVEGTSTTLSPESSSTPASPEEATQSGPPAEEMPPPTESTDPNTTEPIVPPADTSPADTPPAQTPPADGAPTDTPPSDVVPPADTPPPAETPPADTPPASEAPPAEAPAS